jgi:hypothetical protein
MQTIDLSVKEILCLEQIVIVCFVAERFDFSFDARCIDPREEVFVHACDKESRIGDHFRPNANVCTQSTKRNEKGSYVLAAQSLWLPGWSRKNEASAAPLQCVACRSLMP